MQTHIKVQALSASFFNHAKASHFSRYRVISIYFNIKLLKGWSILAKTILKGTKNLPIHATENKIQNTFGK